jgi:hypothetical protein
MFSDLLSIALDLILDDKDEYDVNANIEINDLFLLFVSIIDF